MSKPRVFLFLLIISAILGSIILSSGKLSTKQVSNQCQSISGQSLKQKCWEDLMDQTLEKEGLDKTFVLMDNLFQTEASFALDCHGFAHKLGEKAYGVFINNQQFNLPGKTSYCGYGFYHGFMEKLLHSKGSLDQARSFCKMAGEQLKETNSDAQGACYHGIGHGAVEDITDPKLFGNSQAIVQPSLILCEQLSDTPDKLFRCISGVFNALEIVTTQGKYNLSLNKEDPLSICRTQPERYKRSCYTQMVVAVMNVEKEKDPVDPSSKIPVDLSSNGNFEKAAKILDTIPEDIWATESLSGLAVELVRLGRVDHQTTVNFCRNLSNRFHLPCITGFGEGFMKYGPPQTEYIKAVDFCSFDKLTEEEQNACFRRVLSILRIWYPAEKSRSICQSVDPKFRWQDCNYQ